VQLADEDCQRQVVAGLGAVLAGDADFLDLLDHVVGLTTQFTSGLDLVRDVGVGLTEQGEDIRSRGFDALGFFLSGQFGQGHIEGVTGDRCLVGVRGDLFGQSDVGELQEAGQERGGEGGREMGHGGFSEGLTDGVEVGGNGNRGFESVLTSMLSREVMARSRVMDLVRMLTGWYADAEGAVRKGCYGIYILKQNILPIRIP